MVDTLILCKSLADFGEGRVQKFYVDIPGIYIVIAKVGE